MEGNMRCPHLKKWFISSCNALDKLYVPSLSELQEYCYKSDHRKCPFYLKSIIGTNVSESSFFRI